MPFLAWTSWNVCFCCRQCPWTFGHFSMVVHFLTLAWWFETSQNSRGIESHLLHSDGHSHPWTFLNQSIIVYVPLMHACCHFSCVWLFATLCTVARQAPLSIRFSRQEYWSGLPCLPSGDLPNPRIKPMSFTFPILAGGFFTTSETWEAHVSLKPMINHLDTVPTQDNLQTCSPPSEEIIKISYGFWEQYSLACDSVGWSWS